ncbi:MAG: PepSY domain-containing protein, partial [Pirellulales bacterium]|nr:PepSY domain-containing protein [Pirellulales bacterium]
MSTQVQPPPTIPKPQVEQAESVEAAPNSSTLFYRRIWRWHFYAGLVVLPVVLVAASTGALWVFHEELEPIMYRDLYVVEPQPPRASYEEQLAAARTAAGGAEVTQLRVKFDPETSSRVIATENDERVTIFVNPYTAEVLGEMKKSFFDIVLDLHRRLMIGTPGRIMVELATSWSIVLIITGVYLWWPRGRQRFWGVWLPRIRAKTYVIWRDLHSVTSFYLAILTFLILFTGLLFSFAAGPAWLLVNRQLGGFPDETFAPPPKSVRPEGPAEAISADEALLLASSHDFRADAVSMVLPADEEGVYSVSFQNKYFNPPLLGQVVLDQYGTELRVSRWDDFPLGGKILFYAVPIHFGTLWGMPTKILAFIVCIGLIFATISGAVMWWVRRPQGKTGFPARVAYHIPKWLIATITVLSLIMPSVGVSILLILLGE